jgi:hypothetical protein
MGQPLQRNLQSFLFSYFLFSYISSHFPLLISMSFLIWSIQLVLCLPRGSLPPFFFHISTVICITCPNHHKLLSLISFSISSTSSSNLILAFLNLYFFVLFKIALKNSFPWFEFCYPFFLLLSRFLLHIVTCSYHEFKKISSFIFFLLLLFLLLFLFTTLCQS